MKITLFHVSDIHWLHSSVDAEQEKDFQKSVLSALKRDSSIFQDCRGHKNLLVFSGDLANFYAKEKKDIEEQYEEAFEAVFPVLEEVFQPDEKIAVPGNHDVNRTTNMSKKFETFKKYFHAKDWKTPFGSEPFFEFSLSERKVFFWLINSSELCGMSQQIHCPKCSKDGEVEESSIVCPYCGKELNFILDTVQVGQSARDACIERLSDSSDLRVAVLHHGPLPQTGHFDDKNKKDVFLDNGLFNDLLLSKDFRLVLSGHNHLGGSTYSGRPYANEVKSDSNDLKYRPYSESGFISVAARSMTLAERGTNCGFNVIEIIIDEKSNLANVTVNDFRFFREEGIDSSFRRRAKSFQIALKRIEQVSSEPIRASSMISKTVEYVYDGGSLDALNRIVDPDFGKRNFEDLRSALRRFDSASENSIRSLYNTSVLTPDSWWANNLTGLFRKIYVKNHNYARNAFLNLSPDDPRRHGVGGYGLFFRFTTPLCSGIKKALSASFELKVLDLAISSLNSDESRLTHEETAYIERSVYPTGIVVRDEKRTSLSIWDNHTSGLPGVDLKQKPGDTPPEAGNFSVVIEDTEEDLVFDYREKPVRKQLENRYELARIAIWEPEWLDSPNALHVIRFHEEMGVPFFWLSPKMLLGKNGEPRKPVGSFIVHALLSRSGSEVNERTEPYVVYSDRKAKVAKKRDSMLYSRPMEGYRYMSSPLWGEGQAPSGYSEISNAVDEIRVLLQRPDIMFASDAWVMRRSGRWSDVEEFLVKKGPKVMEWLENPFSVSE